MAQAIAAAAPQGRNRTMVLAALLFAAIAAVLVYAPLQSQGGRGDRGRTDRGRSTGATVWGGPAAARPRETGRAWPNDGSAGPGTGTCRHRGG